MELSHKRILVTGGAGFVGSHLVERLLEEDNEVVVADDFSNSSGKSINDRATVHGLISPIPKQFQRSLRLISMRYFILRRTRIQTTTIHGGSLA